MIGLSKMLHIGKHINEKINTVLITLTNPIARNSALQS